jgi:hypothetical protein
MGGTFAHIFRSNPLRKMLGIIVHDSETPAFFFSGTWGLNKSTPGDGGRTEK